MLQTRMTKQRAIILDFLRSVKTHPSADEIYTMVRKKLPKISLGTVYRNLDMLVSMGKIKCLEKVGIQKHFDGDTSYHLHICCEKCGKIGDIFDPVLLPETDQIVAKDFTVHSMEVTFTGICDECKNFFV